MAIPAKATGAGNNNAQNVFKVAFSEALSTAPIYEGWDNSDTFPAADDEGTTVAKQIFTGTIGNGSKPMLSLVDTTSGAPGANWKPTTPTSGSDNPNRLRGQTYYVTSTATPVASGEILFNMVGEFPFDITIPSAVEMNYLLQIRYTYTGNVPTLTFSFNEGTEGSPSWTTFTPSTHGMRHTNEGASPGSYKMTLPTSGTEDTGEIWITA